MNIKTVFAAVLTAAAVAGCASDGAVTPVGGGAFESNFSTVANIPYPTIKGIAYGRSVNNGAVVDSIVGEVALTKPLDGRARYQFYLVNGLDSTATPISHRQWTIRTDSLLDVDGKITTPVDTTRPNGFRDFWPGAFFSRKLRYAVVLSEADSVHQRAGWLVLTIQTDSTQTRYNDSTPKPLFIRFRDQKGTVARTDDEIATDTVRGNFGEFLSPARQTRFAATGTGSMLVWDVVENGKPALRVNFNGLRKPPKGYFYQPYVVDSLSGIAYAWGLINDGAGNSLAHADLGTDSILANLQAVQPSDNVIGAVENYSQMELILEPKSAAPTLKTGLALRSLMTVQRAPLPPALRAKRAALGTLSVIVTRGTQGGAVAPGVGVVVQGPGNNYNQLISYKNTDSLGVARFTGMPLNELRVLAIPFGGTLVETRATMTAGQTTTVRLVVP